MCDGKELGWDRSASKVRERTKVEVLSDADDQHALGILFCFGILVDRLPPLRARNAALVCVK